MTVAITGATGQLGQLAIAALKQRGAGSELIALARNPASIAESGVAVRAFDYDKPEGLSAALADVDTLVLISSSEIGKRLEQHRNVITAAKTAGVSRIIYTSVLRADVSGLSVADEHRPTEEAIKASGLAYTILRNGWYNENYIIGVPAALQHGAVIGSSGDGRISAASRADYAEAIAVVATTEGHDGKTYELAGDDAFTLSEFAAELSRQTGRDIPYRNLPETDYSAALVSGGVPEGFARLLAGWEVETSRGALFDDGRQLSSLIGRPTTPFASTVARSIG